MIRIITVPCPGCWSISWAVGASCPASQTYVLGGCFDIIHNIYFACDMVRTQTGAPSGWDPGFRDCWVRVADTRITTLQNATYLKKSTDSVTNYFQLYQNVRQWTLVGFQIRTIITQSKQNVLQPSDSSAAAASLREARAASFLMLVWQKGTIWTRHDFNMTINQPHLYFISFFYFPF